MIPRPKQEKVMSKKRRNKASTLTEIKNLMDECRLKYTPDLFRGITEAKHYVILLDLSYDGVPLFKDSSVNNSNAILSFYVANMTKRRCQFDHDAFIAFLIPPEDSPKKLKSSTEYTIIENNKIWGNRDDSIMHYNPNKIKVECTYEKTGSPAGGNFRDLAGMYIGQLTKKGREGFVIRLGSTLCCIQYAVKSIRADMPASNTMLDSDGKLSSNVYCPFCPATKLYFDPLSHDFVENILLNMLTNRKQLHSARSAMSSFQEGDLLRLLPLAQYILHFPSHQDRIISILRDKLVVDNNCTHETGVIDDFINHHLIPALQILIRFTSFLPKGMNPTLGPNRYYFGEYLNNSQLAPTNPKTTHGRIDIPKNTFLDLDNAVAIDIMHAMHKFVNNALDILFFNSVDAKVANKPSEDKRPIQITSNLNPLLNDARKYFGMPKVDYSYVSISADIREKIRRRWKSIDEKKVDISFIQQAIDGEKSDRIIASEKIRFAFCFLPLLTIDCMHDEKVWCIVNLMGLIGEFYSLSGTVSKSKELQYLVNVVLCLMEQYFEPSFISVYYHYLTHLHYCYRTHGLLKDVDCFHCESQYKELKKVYKGGKNPQVSIMTNVVRMKAANLLNKVGPEEISVSSVELPFNNGIISSL